MQLSAIWNTMSRVGLTGVHALPLNRRWVEIHRRRMPLVGLDQSLAGLKLVQISDLHYSPVVWERYLLQFIRWVNDLKPDFFQLHRGMLLPVAYVLNHPVSSWSRLAAQSHVVL